MYMGLLPGVQGRAICGMRVLQRHNSSLLCDVENIQVRKLAARLGEAGLPGMAGKGGEFDVTPQTPLFAEGLSPVTLPGPVPT